jgi:hypothetical protein
MNGRVSNMRFDIKEALHITINGQEYNLAHDWLKLQRNIKVGDSLCKKPKCYDVILVKESGMRFICPRKDK